MDYGFHAPTVSFPVPGTLMVEPTESEPKKWTWPILPSNDSIRQEIQDIESGISNKEDNPLKNSPHTLSDVTKNEWNHVYSRTKAAYPIKEIANNKFWPSVGRVK